MVRAIAIATQVSYQTVYDALNDMAQRERPRRRHAKSGRPVARRSDSRTGVKRVTYERYLATLGWRFVPTMAIGSGCRVHLRADELPQGRIIARLSRHLAAVVDGVIFDTHDPSRDGARCVYGYYVGPETPLASPDDVLEVVVGAGVVEVLQLDDAGACRDIGPITWSDGPRAKKITVRGTRKALRGFQKALRSTFDSTGPMWYKASARAALLATTKLIGPLHPGWYFLPKQGRDEALERYAAERMAAGA